MLLLIRGLMIPLILVSLFAEATAIAYPVKLLHLEYSEGQYSKHIFLIGDIHCRARENSSGGRKLIQHSSWFFNSLPKFLSPKESIPVFWEISRKSALYSKSDLYIHKQAKVLVNRAKIDLIPSDTPRKQSPLLGKLVYLALTKPGIAKAKLDSQNFRRQVARALDLLFLPKSGHPLEKKVSHAIKQLSLPPQVSSSLKQNLRWHRQQLFRLKQNLSYPPNKILAESLVPELKENLSKNTADLEFLVNIFAQPSDLVFVYAGNGHIKRLQKFLYKLGFRASFEVENSNFLPKAAFEAFRIDLKKSTQLLSKQRKHNLLESHSYMTI